MFLKYYDLFLNTETGVGSRFLIHFISSKIFVPDENKLILMLRVG